MPKYLISREIPGAEQLTPQQLHEVARKSNGVIRGLTHEGHDIQWVQSFVSKDRITCVYIAPDEQTLREHAIRGDFPANGITQVSRVIDPMTGEVPPS